MGFIESIYEKAQLNKQRIAIPECTNQIMMRAALKSAADGIADVVFVGKRKEIEAAARKIGAELSPVRIAETNDMAYRETLIERYGELPKRSMGKKSVSRRMDDPLYMAMVMEAVGEVDCTLAGLDTTTYEFMLAASGIIGLAEGVTTPSGLLILEIEGFEGEQGNCFGMSDGAVCIEPTAEQLAGIAISSCDAFEALMGRPARCALLSHSTCGSSSGAVVSRIREALELVRTQRPELMVDGEFQSDAAILSRVAAKKVPHPSEVAGRADLLVFPDAPACNIGSKLVQIFAKCRSYGPVYQGFKLPVLDCSRGDTEERLYDNIALCGVLAGSRRGAGGNK